MRSPADIIYSFLSGSALTLSEMFVAFLPDAPDETVVIFDTAGRLDGRLMATGEQIEHFGVQIQVRGKDYSSTYDMIRNITLLLDSVKKESVAVDSDEVYVLHNVSRSGSIIPVGIETIEDRRRHLFTVNMTITISQAT